MSLRLALELNPEDSPENAAKIEQQVNNWNDVEWDLKRLIKLARGPARAVGDIINKLDFGVDAFFLSLTFPDVRVSNFLFRNIFPRPNSPSSSRQECDIY